LISLAQSPTKLHGEGSVTFESAGGKWQKALITDGLTGETSAAYSLDAESSAIARGIDRHPRIEFSCGGPGKVDNVRIRTGAVIADQSNGVSDSSARVSIQTEDQEIQTWTVVVAKNGSDLLIGKQVISDFLTHKRFVIKFVSASGAEISDEYVTKGLSMKSLKEDCFAL
jgi:hypothetical protein